MAFGGIGLPPPPSSAASPPSSRSVKWSLTQLNDGSSAASEPGRYLSISAMDPFKSFSLEELRSSDYARGDKGADSSPAPADFQQLQQQQQQQQQQQPNSLLFPIVSPPTASSAFPSFMPPPSASTPVAPLSLSQPSPYASSFPSLANPASQPSSSSLFPSMPPVSSSPSLFPSAQPTSSLFPSASASSASSLFPTPASSSLFPPPAASSAPASSLFPTSSSLFPPSQPALSSFPTAPSLFPSLPAAQPAFQPLAAPPADAPLQAALTENPFGLSTLITGASTITNTTTTPSLIPPLTSSSSTTAAPATVLVGNPSTTTALPRIHPNPPPSVLRSKGSHHPLSRPLAPPNTRPDARGWFLGSPMRPWGKTGSLFQVSSSSSTSSTIHPSYSSLPPNLPNSLPLFSSKHHPSSSINHNTSVYASWRTDEQKLRAANIKKLVIEPLSEDLERAHQRHRDKRRSRRLNSFSTPQKSSKPLPVSRTMAGFATPRISIVARENPRQNSQRLSDSDSVPPSDPPHPDPDHHQMLPIPDDPLDSPQNHHDSPAATDSPLPPAHDDDGDDYGEPVDEHAHMAVDTDKKDPTIVQYSEVYRAQMAAGRRASEGEAAHRSTMPHASSVVPICTREGSFTIPSLEQMHAFPDETLSCLRDFTYGVDGIGEVTWLEGIDVRGMNLDEIIMMKPRELCVYPDASKMPPRGQGLNRPARVKLHGIWKWSKNPRAPMKNPEAVMAIVSRLKSHCEKDGLLFLGYDVGKGTWTFEAEHF